MTEQAMTKKRPFVATVLAIAAGIAGVLAVVHTLQALGILPYVIGPIKVRSFDLWYAFMWGLIDRKSTRRTPVTSGSRMPSSA